MAGKFQVVCPRCQNSLAVPAEASERWLTCPRCLSSVGNPHVLSTADKPASSAASGSVTPVAGPPARGGSLCPSCDRAVEPGFRFCPYCNATLRQPAPGRRRSPLDRDIRRDTGAGRVVGIVLSALAILGVVLFLASGGPQSLGGSSRGVQDTITWIAVIVGITVVSCIVLAVRSKSKAAGIFSGVLGGVAVGLGVGMVILLAILAAFIDMLHTCLSCGKPPH